MNELMQAMLPVGDILTPTTIATVFVALLGIELLMGLISMISNRK